MRSPLFLHPVLVPCLLLAVAPVMSQPVAPAAAAASAPQAAAAAAPASAPQAPATGTVQSQRVEITGGRESDTEARRRSTAAKIVIGREEIDKFGDATVGEVLRRLPGVTTPGAPGRGGPPRMRGLGNGFTQLLIDGQRMPPGFSLESLTPEQIERIEILRAPTAETGARAIAGTINIITREGFKLRLNDLRIGAGVESGQVSPGINWTHNDTRGALTYNVSASLFKRRSEDLNDTRVTVADATSGALLEDRSSHTQSHNQRYGLNLTSRLTWRLGESGDMLVLMPSVFHTENHADHDFNLIQALRRSSTLPFYDTGRTAVDGHFSTGRLGAQWRQRVGDTRLELNGNGGASRSRSDSLRNEYNAGNPAPIRTLEDHTTTQEKSINLTLKASRLSAAAADPSSPPAAEHSLVTGGELEALSRTENRSTVPDLTDFADNLKASSLRLAAYAQDEWNITPNWGTHAGLRWEGITTRGDNATGERPSNRSSVWTPLLHAVWKPDPKSRDQLRMSLTRSYRSPGLGSLIARPSISRNYPVTGSNVETAPDSAGNPGLKPELATGIDVAIERYLEGGGVLSANLFHRNISNLMRGVTTLETVSWSPVQRWVRRQSNIGDATTSGLELEAKFRLDRLISAALPVELRSNLSLYRSNVKAVPGPDNRLDQQAKATANLGGDYRLRGLPLSLGGNVNWVPGFTTRVDFDQTVSVTTKQVWDAYALWTFSPALALRLLANNLDPREYANTTVNDTVMASTTASTTERTTVRSVGPSFVNWQLRMELKL